MLKIYDGSGWVTKPVQVWDGTDWVAKPVKWWDGAQWVQIAGVQQPSILTDHIRTGGIDGSSLLTIPSFVMPPGSNRLLLVATCDTDTFGANSVAFGSTPLALSHAAPAWSTLRRLKFWYLLDPPTETSNIVVTGGTSPNVRSCVAVVIPIEHVNQSDPFGEIVSYTNTSLTSVNRTTTADGPTDLFLSALGLGGKPAGLTELFDSEYVSERTVGGPYQSYVRVSQKTPILGENTAGYSWTNSNNAAMIAFAIHGAS